MKKAVKIILCIVLAVVLFVAASVGRTVYITEYRLTDKGTELSPDGKYSVLFQMVGEPDWPFGATTVRVTVKNTETGEEIEVIQTDIHDDGALLRENNWNVEWYEEEVKITLIGSEQNNDVYNIDLR